MVASKKPFGRPTVFTEKLLDQILEEISHGASEYSIFERSEMPCWSAWTKFKRSRPDFIPKYAQAKEDNNEFWEAKIMQHALNESRDQVPDGKGGFKSDNTAVNRDRLIIDTKKWLMAKMQPKKYGDKVQQEVTGADGKDFIPVLNISLKKEND